MTVEPNLAGTESCMFSVLGAVFSFFWMWSLFLLVVFSFFFPPVLKEQPVFSSVKCTLTHARLLSMASSPSTNHVMPWISVPAPVNHFEPDMTQAYRRSAQKAFIVRLWIPGLL